MSTKVTLAVATAQTLAQEAQHVELNALGFVRGETAQDQWYILVNDAWNASRFPENQIVKDYLGTMLYRFMSRNNLFEELKYFGYAEHVLGVKRLDAPCVQDVADMALQYVAFFPERSTYRHEPRSLRYSAELGVNLYRELAWQAAGKDDWFSKAFAAMANSFGLAVMVLRSVCPRFVEEKRVRTAVAESAVRILSDHEATKTLRAVRNFGLLYGVASAPVTAPQ